MDTVRTGAEPDPADDFDTDAYIRAAAPLLGLELDAERRAAVGTFLGIARGMAAILEAAPVPAGSLALAPVFAPDDAATG